MKRFRRQLTLLIVVLSTLAAVASTVCYSVSSVRARARVHSVRLAVTEQQLFRNNWLRNSATTVTSNPAIYNRNGEVLTVTYLGNWATSLEGTQLEYGQQKLTRGESRGSISAKLGVPVRTEPVPGATFQNQNDLIEIYEFRTYFGLKALKVEVQYKDGYTARFRLS